MVPYTPSETDNRVIYISVYILHVLANCTAASCKQQVLIISFHKSTWALFVDCYFHFKMSIKWMLLCVALTWLVLLPCLAHVRSGSGCYLRMSTILIKQNFNVITIWLWVLFNVRVIIEKTTVFIYLMHYKASNYWLLHKGTICVHNDYWSIVLMTYLLTYTYTDAYS